MPYKINSFYRKMSNLSFIKRFSHQPLRTLLGITFPIMLSLISFSLVPDYLPSCVLLTHFLPTFIILFVSPDGNYHVICLITPTKKIYLIIARPYLCTLAINSIFRHIFYQYLLNCKVILPDLF